MLQMIFPLIVLLLAFAYFAVAIRGYQLQRKFSESMSVLQTAGDARIYEAMVGVQMKLALLAGAFGISAILLFIGGVFYGLISVPATIVALLFLLANRIFAGKLKLLEEKLMQMPARNRVLEARRDYLVGVWRGRVWPRFEPFVESHHPGVEACGMHRDGPGDGRSGGDAKSTLSIPLSLGALIIAAAVIPIFMGLITQSAEFGRGVFIVSAAHLLLALPLVLVFRRYDRINAVTCVSMGFIVGVLPVAIWAWPLRYSELSGNVWKGASQTQTLRDDIPTAAGWLSYAEALAPFGVFGGITGAVFWVILKHARRLGRSRGADHHRGRSVGRGNPPVTGSDQRPELPQHVSRWAHKCFTGVEY